MRFKTKKQEEPIISIAPLIDIVFLLLIFFMVTSHFHVASGVPIKLPKITQNAYDGKTTQDIIVAIDQAGAVYLKGERIELAELGSKLKEILQQDRPARLLLQADKEAKHGIVVQVMDIAKTSGVSSIVIAAQWDPKEEL